MVGDIGMLWQVDPGKILPINVEEGLAAHLKKYGKPAEFVDLHPEVLAAQFVVREGVDIREDPMQAKNTMFIGVSSNSSHAENAEKGK